MDIGTCQGQWLGAGSGSRATTQGLDRHDDSLGSDEGKGAGAGAGLG